MANIQDNIADTEVTTSTTADVTADGTADSVVDMDYLERFDKVSATNEQLAKILLALDKAPYDQERIQVSIKYLNLLQKQNESMYDLLVEMNNVIVGIHDKIM
jgi:hypothetical protein